MLKIVCVSTLVKLQFDCLRQVLGSKDTKKCVKRKTLLLVAFLAASKNFFKYYCVIKFVLYILYYNAEVEPYMEYRVLSKCQSLGS